MNDDLLRRARQALQPALPKPEGAGRAVEKSRPQLPALNHAQGKELLARAQAAIAAPPRQVLVAVPPSPPAPRGEWVELPVMCSARGIAYVVIAERRGDV